VTQKPITEEGQVSQCNWTEKYEPDFSQLAINKKKLEEF
jgi:hypothetical protein